MTIGVVKQNYGKLLENNGNIFGDVSVMSEGKSDDL